jgi:hypothetical protein
VTVGQRSGVGVVELAILEVLDARRAGPGRRAVQCEKVLAALGDEMGLDRKYAWQALIDVTQPWKLPVPLVDGIGNFGSRGSDPPAGPRYSEARLSPAGQLALAAERGQIAPVPIGMINGTPTGKACGRRSGRPPSLTRSGRSCTGPGCPGR